ncbi:hypothetical protein HYZ97_01015 [Candidatus Pacearchaeota archaeon]|nr:hypothetical protein [Candidatus Pacearchaeota archaeon]
MSTATTFQHTSTINAACVKAALHCSCEPYKDVFTYNRWKAQGYQVQRGEKAIKLPLVKDVEVEKEGETTTKRILGISAVFCRHQVKPSESREVKASESKEGSYGSREDHRTNNEAVSSKFILERV